MTWFNKDYGLSAVWLRFIGDVGGRTWNRLYADSSWSLVAYYYRIAITSPGAM